HGLLPGAKQESLGGDTSPPSSGPGSAPSGTDYSLARRSSRRSTLKGGRSPAEVLRCLLRLEAFELPLFGLGLLLREPLLLQLVTLAAPPRGKSSSSRRGVR